MGDIYNCKRRFEKACEKFDSLNLNTEDKLLVQKFIDYCLCHNISYGKISVYLHNLKIFIKELDKPISEATKEDIGRVMIEIGNYKWKNGTKNVFKIVVRRMYQIIHNMEDTTDFPDVVRWVKLDIKKRDRHLPEELLTNEELDMIIENCKSIRDKAFIAILAESGARIGEIASMKIKHISFESYGARLTLYGKTGSRRILVSRSAKILKEWIGMHPFNNVQDSYLWPADDGRLICYNALRKVMKKAALKAGIQKRIYPHLFRYTRATQLANIMSDQVMKQYLGWDKNSNMHEIYIHMSGKESDEAILKESGMLYTALPQPKQTTLIFSKPIIQRLMVEN
jgi:site-specific recombinase XerD